MNTIVSCLHSSSLLHQTICGCHTQMHKAIITIAQFLLHHSNISLKVYSYVYVTNDASFNTLLSYSCTHMHISVVNIVSRIT